MTELELLVDFHKDAERQGPGSAADTLRALSFIDLELNRPLKVADIGCGTGGQTITLARNMDAEITAVDLFPEFLDRLQQKSASLGLQDTISPVQTSMDNLPFSREEYDIIWSEGAIYIIGFEAGIRKWKGFLKPGGYLALSEITWITDSRPREIEEHWNNEYPEIDTASGKIRILEENGFSPVGYFYLPESSWIDTYYKPAEERFEEFLQRHGNSQAAINLVKTEREEIRKYRKYGGYFSYGFYVARKLPEE